jgi:hypothetical protein
LAHRSFDLEEMMFRPIIVAFALCGVAACSNQYQPLPMVKSGDPVFQLNQDRWTATANDLMAPPGDGAPRTLAQPIPTRAHLYE